MTLSTPARLLYILLHLLLQGRSSVSLDFLNSWGLLADASSAPASGSLSLDDCNRVELGCWQDSKPGDKAPGATGKRVLPYCWCPGAVPITKNQCKTPDCKYNGIPPPKCEAAKMTPRVCAQVRRSLRLPRARLGHVLPIHAEAYMVAPRLGLSRLDWNSAAVQGVHSLGGTMMAACSTNQNCFAPTKTTGSSTHELVLVLLTFVRLCAASNATCCAAGSRMDSGASTHTAVTTLPLRRSDPAA